MTDSLYAGTRIALTTKHDKGRAVGPAFERLLGATVFEYRFDTDSLGTFSGEIARVGSALDAAKEKTRLALKHTSSPFALASEGSFGPHPEIGFIPVDRELLYFVDRERDFALTETLTTPETNYKMAEIGSLAELHDFAERAKFPSHGLILSTLPRVAERQIRKGIQTWDALDATFHDLRAQSHHPTIRVETDMRASFNPTRMGIIERLADTLAYRLATHCPCCDAPGWGKVGETVGLECAWCSTPTRLIKALVHGCTRCGHTETVGRPDGLRQSDPGHCAYCNP